MLLPILGTHFYEEPYYSKNKVNSPPPLKPGERIEVPTGVAMFPGEKDLIVPREFAERCYNIQHWTDMPSGGHFAALEEPELLVKDIRQFAQTLKQKKRSTSGINTCQ